MKKITELRNLSKAELFSELESNHKEIFSLRMQKGAGQAIKPHIMRDIKKTIARIKTLIRQNAGDQQ